MRFEARRTRRAGFTIQHILPHPEERSGRTLHPGGGQSQPAQGRAIVIPVGVEFVQGSGSQRKCRFIVHVLF